MAFQQEEEDLAFSAAYEDDTPTPPGWKRKLVPRIGKGMVPVRTDVIFVTPSGDEFKSRAQLQRYLKANKGSPSLSEFIWIVDGMPQRSTRSKSTPMGKLLEIQSKADSKRKPGADINVGIGKPRRTGKARKSEDVRIIKGNHIKNADMVILSEGKDEGNEFTGSSPASSKRKRTMKARINRGPAPTVTNSANTNGVADISNKDDNADETVKNSSFNKASKRKRSKARSVGKKGATPQDPSDDFRQEADVVNADVSSGGATNAESDTNARGEGYHPEGRADVGHNNETMAVNA